MKYAGKNVEGQRNYDRMWLKHHKTLEAKGSAAAKETPAQKKTPAPKASTNAVKRASSEGTLRAAGILCLPEVCERR